MTNYIRPILNRFIGESKRVLNAIRISPSTKEPSEARYYGAVLDKETARKLGLQLLVACEVTETEVSIFIDKEKNGVFIQNEDKSYYQYPKGE